MLKLKMVKMIKKMATEGSDQEVQAESKNYKFFKKTFFKNSKILAEKKDLDNLYQVFDKYGIEISHFVEDEKKLYLENKNGIKFVTDMYYWIVFEIFCAELYKPVNYYFQEDYVVVDFGMNRAYTALYLAQSENCKRLFGFEPCSKTYAFAKENIGLNPNFANKISAFNYGISNKDEELEISTVGGRDGVSTFVEDFKNDYLKGIHSEEFVKETIQVKDVSKVLDEIKIKNFKCKKILKIDIEGAEYDVLDKMIETGYLDIFDMVIGGAHIGFRRFANKLVNFKCVHKVKLADGVYDVCFIKKEK